VSLLFPLTCRIALSDRLRISYQIRIVTSRLNHPSYVIGRSLIANSAEELFDGTNAVALSFLTGKSDPDTPPEPAMSVHVDDIALAHVLALDKEKIIPSTAGVGNYLVAQSKPLIHTLEVRSLYRTLN
jgi:hypothetical protein